MLWIVIGFIFIAALLFLSAFFAAAEMAFVSADRVVVRGYMQKGNSHAVLLDGLLEEPDAVVSALVVGNNIVNITASIVAGAIITHHLGNVGIGIATVLMTLLIIIFGEATPKAFGINNVEFALRIARSVAFTKKIFYPVARVFNIISSAIISLTGWKKARAMAVTEHEIKVMLDLGVEKGTIEKDEKELVEEVFDFDETKAVEVFTPREDLVSLSEQDTVKKMIDAAIRTGYSRFPLRRENIDDITGMVHIKDALTHDDDTPLSEIMRDILKISPGMKVDDVLREMQKRKVHMAILQSREGKTIGLVTLEDLVEEVFGEIRDEHDIT
jgi:CBS domain containing-hemolysin-like protein